MQAYMRTLQIYKNNVGLMVETTDMKFPLSCSA